MITAIKTGVLRLAIMLSIVLLCLSAGCSHSELPLEDLAEQPPDSSLEQGDSSVLTAKKEEKAVEVEQQPLPVQTPAILAPFVPLQASGCDTQSYIPGPGDELMITVTGQNDYRMVKDVTIGINGSFSFDYIGEIAINSMTIPELEKDLRTRLAQDFLVNPAVSISITKYQSHRVFLSGEVVRPGEFIMKKQCQWLSEVLLDAGGLQGNFNKYAFVISGTMDVSDAAASGLKIIDLYSIFIEGNRSGDHLVYDKDIIQVYDKGINPLGPQNSIFIFGEVVKPGMYPYSNDLTVLSAILIYAGGFTKAAKKNRTVVKREQDKEVETLTIDLDDVMQGQKDLDVQLKPGDIIRVPRTFF